MKKIIYLSAAFLLTFASCKKDNKTNPTSASGTFVIEGTTYTQSQGIFAPDAADNLSSLEVYGANGSKKGSLGFYFAGTAKPAAGTYTIGNTLNTLTATQVGILAVDSVNVAHEAIFGANTGSVTVTVNNGKLSISMSNISFSGSIIDNSDPNNSKSTDANTTCSASIKEY